MIHVTQLVLTQSNLSAQINEVQTTNINIITPASKINADFLSCSRMFKIGHLNCQSIPKHIEELKHIMYATDFDVILASETWFTKSVPRSHSSIDGYQLVRNDRLNKRGGGVCMYLRNGIKYKIIFSSNSIDEAEVLWLELSFNHTSLAVGVLYKPPRLPYGVLSSLCESLSNIICKYKLCVLMGDFNIDLLTPNTPAANFLKSNIIDNFSLTYHN